MITILQTLPDDCSEVAVAMVVGRNEHDVVTQALAEGVYRPGVGAYNYDLPRLLHHYGVHAVNDALTYRQLRATVKAHGWAIAGVSNVTLWGTGTGEANHDVVVIKATAHHVTVKDPARGEYTVDRVRFLAAWQGDTVKA